VSFINNLTLATWNAHGIKYKLNELNLALRCRKTFSKLIDVLTLTETWLERGAKHNILPDYWEFWKHAIPQEKSVRGKGGLGILIHKRHAVHFNKFYPKKEHENILWVRWRTHSKDLYIAAIYSTPGDLASHKEILSTLELNVKEIGPDADIMLTGDLNSHLSDIGGKTNTYGQDLQNCLEANHWEPILPPTGEPVNKHFSFERKSKNKSVRSSPDHLILIPARHKGLRASPRVTHQKIRFGSDHCFLLTTLNARTTRNTQIWEQDPRSRVNWSPERIIRQRSLTEISISAWLRKWGPNYLITPLVAQATEELIKTLSDPDLPDPNPPRGRKRKKIIEPNNFQRLKKERDNLYSVLYATEGTLSESKRSSLLNKISTKQKN
jgi:hypothetical protein